MDETEFDMSNFAGTLAEIDRKQADLEAANRRLATVKTTARSADGLVEVTVSATGAVTEVKLAPEAFRSSTPQYLGNSVTEAAQQATRQVRASATAAAAPIAAVGKELSAAVDAPRAAHSTKISARPTGVGAESTSADRTARVGVDPMGIVAVVHISPDAYRGNTTRLAAAITEAAERAARQIFETRMGPVESAVGVGDSPNMDVYFPIPVAPEPTTPSAPPPPPTPVPPAVPAAPAARWDPYNGRPGDRVVGPSDWDDDTEGYEDQTRSRLR